MAITRQKHDRNMRTPDMLTQEDFDRDEDPVDELGASLDQKRHEHDKGFFPIPELKYSGGWRKHYET